MSEKTLGGGSSAEKVIKCTDGGTRIYLIKGVGGVMHQSAPNAKKQKQFLTMLYEQEEQKLTTPSSKKPHPFPKEFSLLTCAFKKKKKKPKLNSSLNAAGPKYQYFFKVHASAL